MPWTHAASVWHWINPAILNTTISHFWLIGTVFVGEGRLKQGRPQLVKRVPFCFYTPRICRSTLITKWVSLIFYYSHFQGNKCVLVSERLLLCQVLSSFRVSKVNYFNIYRLFKNNKLTTYFVIKLHDFGMKCFSNKL